MLLAGGFKHQFYFPFHISDVILPIDFHLFTVELAAIDVDWLHHEWIDRFPISDFPMLERSSLH